MIPQIRNSRARVTRARIAEIEEQLDVELPAPYRNFLLQHNGGRPRPATFVPKGESEATETVHCFLAIDGDPDVDDLLTNVEDYGGRISDAFLPVALDAFGNLICIRVKGKSKNRIYFWDHEMEDDEDIDPMRLVAEDWDTFVSSFQD